MKSPREAISQVRALLTSLGIVAYFAIATVWIPSALLRSPLLVGVDRNLADLIALGIWGTGLGLGIWALRRAQDRDLI